jgi:hypothetical protein
VRIQDQNARLIAIVNACVITLPEEVLDKVPISVSACGTAIDDPLPKGRLKAHAL